MTQNLNLVPGAGLIGFGVNLALANGPTDVSKRIIGIDATQGTPISQNGFNYLLPANVSIVEDSSTSLDTNTFSDKSEYCKHFSTEVETSVSGWGFSGQFDADYSSISDGESIAFYGLIEAQTRLWSLSLQDLSNLTLTVDFQQALTSLPAEFTSNTQQAFFDFFNNFGTHVITTSVVGGMLNYLVAVSSSSNLTKEAVNANLGFEYDALFVEGSADLKVNWSKLDNSWVSSRKARLTTSGGTPDVLTQAVPPSDPSQPVNYQSLVNTWVASVVTNPAVIETKLQSIARLAPIGQSHIIDKALSVYLSAGIYVSHEFRIKTNVDNFPYGAIVFTGAAGTININNVNIDAPNTSNNPLPNYWIVLADEKGNVQFNQNVLSDDPDDFDTLIEQAKHAGGTNPYWVAVIAAAEQPKNLSVNAISWLNSCGVELTDWHNYYSFGNQFVGVGMLNAQLTGSSETGFFDPRTYVNPPDKEWSEQLNISVNVAFPLYLPIY